MGNFLEDLSKQKLLGYFLILWGASFFFDAIEDFVYSSYGYWRSGYTAVIIVHDVVFLAIAAVLVLLGLKVLGINIGGSSPPSTPKN
jgi:hypothetical protein